jgi:energy-coupling factor transporter ATP-binding protein EcfA2
MPNSIKYSVSAQTLALKKGNFWVGTGDVGKGPTSTTDYYNGVTPPAGGYTIYLNKASQGPAIYTVGSDAALISLSNRIAGQTFETAAAALAWFATQTDKMVFNADYDGGIPTDGLVLMLDAGFTPSYPTSGTSWYDLSSNANTCTLTNGPTFNSGNGGQIVFDGSDDFVSLPNGIISGLGDFTVVQWVQNSGSGYTTFANYPSGELQVLWATNYVGFYLQNSSAYASAGTYHTNAITMIVARRISYITTFFKNASLIVTGSSQANLGSSSATFRLGLNTVSSEAYSGKIFNTLVYNRGLTTTEITTIYNAQKGRFGL